MRVGMRVVRLMGNRVVSMKLVWVELCGLCVVRPDGGEGRWRCDREPAEVEGEP